MPIHHVSDTEDFQKMLDSNKYVVVDFHAPWCGPCRTVQPVFEAAASDPKYSKVTFGSVDVDELDEVGELQGIKGLPTIKYYRDGTLVDEVVGADLTAISEKLEKNMD